MKKLFVVVLLALSCLCTNAQIFTKKTVYDKFDDVISDKTIKTLITCDENEDLITIEEKGSAPTEYVILNISESGTEGSKDEIVNLVTTVYGYQTTWCVIKKQDEDAYSRIYTDMVYEEDKDVRSEYISQLSKYWLFITNRVIVTRYTHDYDTEYWWISDGKNNGRTIYSK